MGKTIYHGKNGWSSQGVCKNLQSDLETVYSSTERQKELEAEVQEC